MSRREEILDRISQYQKELSDLDRMVSRFGDDDYETGEVIVFRKRFQSGIYDYAAIKGSDGLWYTTGPKSLRGYDWDELCRFMSEGVSRVYWASVLERIF